MVLIHAQGHRLALSVYVSASWVAWIICQQSFSSVWAMRPVPDRLLSFAFPISSMPPSNRYPLDYAFNLVMKTLIIQYINLLCAVIYQLNHFYMEPIFK
jgi:hypothetical protein